MRFLFIYAFHCNFLQNVIFFIKKNVFCGSVGNDLFMWLVRVEVRLYTSGSPHTQSGNYLGVVVVEETIFLSRVVAFLEKVNEDL